MTTYVIRDGQLVDKRFAPRQPVARSHLPCPAIRPDGMSDTWNPATGLLYDSRSAYYRAVKDAGCEIVGDDRAFSEPSGPPRTPDHVLEREIAHDVKDAIEQLGG